MDTPWKQIGVVGVDSGQLMLTDPCYLRSEWKADLLAGSPPEGEYSYRGACAATASKERSGQLRYGMGHAGAGVAFQTGYGDGVYPVFARLDDEERIVEVRVVMDRYALPSS